MAKELPAVKILATGGTIAGTAASSTQLTGYKAGDIGIQTLLNAVPEVNNIAVVSGEQVANIDSKDMTGGLWLKLAERCNKLFASDEVKGIVITHGTDTLEETAYFLNLTVHSDKPVVLTGAMRPATAVSADGPLNLLQAVRLAAEPEAKGKGVLVALNEQILGARDVTKTNTENVATFKAPELGFMGYFAAGEPYFYNASTRRHTVNAEFETAGIEVLPRVFIIYGHADGAPELIEAAVKAGARGIIYAGTGNGSIHKYDEKPLYDAQAAGIVVVRSSRVGNGRVVPGENIWEEHHFINGDTLSPQKARILLQLALTKTNDTAEIQRIFNEY